MLKPAQHADSTLWSGGAVSWAGSLSRARVIAIRRRVPGGQRHCAYPQKSEPAEQRARGRRPRAARRGDRRAATARPTGGGVRAGPDVIVEPPRDGRARFLIDAMAAYVDADGPAFEAAVMAAEASNPEFGFLFDLRAPDHAYYRWRLFSLASGDTLRAWRVEPFVMVEGGPRRAAPRPPAALGGAYRVS